MEIDIAETAHLPAIDIDPAHLQAAITNLVVNARDAMRNGGKVRINFEEVAAGSAPPELGESPALVIHVSDNGEGMSPAVLQRVLEPFFTTKGNGKGTGLGLAMVHGMMVQTGGALRIESLAGTGTTVSLFVPISPASPAMALEAGRRHHTGGRILLLDDDKPVAGFLKSQLLDWGYRVHEAGRPAEVMQILGGGEAFAFVIADLTTGSNGEKLAAKVRGMQPKLPILGMSARASASGPDDKLILRKPFSPETLSTAILDFVEHARQTEERDAVLDRLQARFKSPRLKQVFRAWRNACHRHHLPRLENVAAAPGPQDIFAIITVDQTHVPMQFHTVMIGADLASDAGPGVSSWNLQVTGNNDDLSREGAYRGCVRSQKPTYEFARLDFGDGRPSSLERLLLPCSNNDLDVTSLIAVVIVAMPAQRTG